MLLLLAASRVCIYSSSSVLVLFYKPILQLITEHESQVGTIRLPFTDTHHQLSFTYIHTPGIIRIKEEILYELSCCCCTSTSSTRESSRKPGSLRIHFECASYMIPDIKDICFSQSCWWGQNYWHACYCTHEDNAQRSSIVRAHGRAEINLIAVEPRHIYFTYCL